MADRTNIIVDGRSVHASPGQTVAAALIGLGLAAWRHSPSGEARGPLCGMGVCQECHVTIDGIAHRRACLVAAVDGMIVETGMAST
jgi:D-hydroxyproline dehydrogenase subunit gamma